MRAIGHAEFISGKTLLFQQLNFTCLTADSLKGQSWVAQRIRFFVE